MTALSSKQRCTLTCKKNGYNYSYEAHKNFSQISDFKILNWNGLDLINISHPIKKIVPPPLTKSPHKQKQILLIKIIKGDVTIIHNNNYKKFSSGDFLLLDLVKSIELIYEKRHVHLLSIHLPRTEFFDGHPTDIENIKSLKANHPKAKMLNSIFKQSNCCIIDPMVDINFLFDLVRLAFTKTTNLQMQPYEKNQTRYLNILKILDQHFSDMNFNLDMLSEISNISRRQLQRDFCYNGSSFSSELIIRRLSLFSKKLHLTVLSKQPNINISQIAFQCGFSDISTFNRKFKKHFRCTPTEYISEVKQNKKTC